MTKKEKNAVSKKLWADVDITKDFEEALENVEEVDAGDYNTEGMVYFSANVNYARQLLRLSDSLKPVHRRILFQMYKQGLKNGGKKKSISVVGSVTDIHPHGGASVYSTMVGIGQYWKMPVPLVKIIGSFGTEVSSTYAADRYTEITMSDYAWDCFFKDYDEDCVEMIYNTAGSRLEPVSLPSRYPNILINGGNGIAIGNAFRIAPYNINDVIEETKKRLRNKNCGHCYMVPDLPTGCDIVDDGESLKQICETGKGTLRMRAKVNIVDEGKFWGLQVTNIPAGVALETIVASIVSLTKSGQIPVRDVQQRHEQIVEKDGTVISHVNMWIMVEKSHDPYAVREKLFKKTKLEEYASINFNVVLEELKLGSFSLSDMIYAWIDQRREYKRRLINKRISKITARIQTLKVLIDIMGPGKLETTVQIIRGSKEADIAKNLVKKYGMSSFQAEQIAGMRISTFNAEAPAKFKKELQEAEESLQRQLKLVKSEKAIDDVIAAELDELKKYATPRKSQLISLTGQTMDTKSDFIVVVTKKGRIKKVSEDAVMRSRKGLGTFEPGDYPTQVIKGKNQDTIVCVDSLGRCSVLTIGSIDTSAISEPARKAYDYLKLEGEIVAMTYLQTKENIDFISQNISPHPFYLISVTKNGLCKRVSAATLVELTNNGTKSVKNAKLIKLGKGDEVRHVDYYMADTNILIYTEQGEFNYIRADMIPDLGRDAMGNVLIKLSAGDECIGCCAVRQPTEDLASYLVVATAKGKVKKIEVQYLGMPTPKKDPSYLITCDEGDKVIYADCPMKSIEVQTKTGVLQLDLEEIPTLSRKAKGSKKIPVAPGDNIVNIVTH